MGAQPSVIQSRRRTKMYKASRAGKRKDAIASNGEESNQLTKIVVLQQITKRF